ncbi:hypothetical protein K2P47_05360 [Patescibacteria group bacterium]|nr:hypothetical protein [Patescibacteria group bacterium]
MLKTNTPTVQPLPRARRRFVFLTLLLFFVIAVPMFVFYATGYRYDFAGDGAITTTGGLYVTVGSEEGDVYLNEEPVRDMRIFRNAIFIQNIVPGMQRVHVQAEGLHTWVKDLPVYPYIVTEAESFSLPVIPQIRPIAQFQTATGTLVFPGVASGTELFTGVSTSVPFITATSSATSSYTRNPEYDFVIGLFSTSTATSTLLTRVVDGVTTALTRNQSEPATTSTSTLTSAEMATTTKTSDDLVLSESEGDIFVTYVGPKNSTPYYFCVPKATLASTSALYGNHVMMGVAQAVASENVPTVSDIVTERTCRTTIRIDRQWKTVLDFDFFPSTTDLIVLHREDGISVVEVDDRAWQNTQMLYTKPVDELVINNGRLYAKDGDMIFELLTALPTE